MHREDLLRIIGAKSEDAAGYLPVAMLLRSGYPCFGHFNAKLNDGLVDSIVILNAQLMEFSHAPSRSRAWVEDFREFLVEVVAAEESGESPSGPQHQKTIPLLAIPLTEIALVYPLAHMVELLQLAGEAGGEEGSIPTLFDLDKSEILAALRTRLW